MSIHKTIGVLGCGWLGLPLALALQEQGYNVRGTTTSVSKKTLLQQQLKNIFIIEVQEEGVLGEVESFFTGLDILIINIPPGLRKSSESNYVLKIELLISKLIKYQVCCVLYVSSTAVFPNTNQIFIEKDVLVETDNKTRQLIEAENRIKDSMLFKSTIIRFAGLVNEQRHPVTMLSRRSEVANPESPINLIHQEDCIGLLLRIIEGEFWSFVFHGVAPFHPTKRSYYNNEALKRNLKLVFAKNTSCLGKVITSDFTTKTLQYSFLKPHL